MLRYFLFVVAVIVQASGIALVVKSMLGTSPISSLPYVISLASPFTLGQMTFSINMLLVLGQYLLLRRAFDNIQFLQIPDRVVAFTSRKIRRRHTMDLQKFQMIGL